MRATSEQIRLANCSEQAESETVRRLAKVPFAFKDPGVEMLRSCCGFWTIPTNPNRWSPVRQRMQCKRRSIASLRPTMVHAHADRHDAHARPMEPCPSLWQGYRCRALVGSTQDRDRPAAEQIFACIRGCLPQFVSSRTLQRTEEPHGKPRSKQLPSSWG